MPNANTQETIDIEALITLISDVRGYKTSNKLSLGAELEQIEIC